MTDKTANARIPSKSGRYFNTLLIVRTLIVMLIMSKNSIFSFIHAIKSKGVENEIYRLEIVVYAI